MHGEAQITSPVLLFDLIYPDVPICLYFRYLSFLTTEILSVEITNGCEGVVPCYLMNCFINYFHHRLATA